MASARHDIFNDKILTWKRCEEMARRAGGLNNIKTAVQSACQTAVVYGNDRRWAVQLNDWNQATAIEQSVKKSIATREIQARSAASSQQSLTDPPQKLKELNFILGTKFPCTVYVHTGDITTLRCDAVVNAANGRLQHGAGVACALKRKCSSDYQLKSLSLIKQHGGPLADGEAICQEASGSLKDDYGVKFVVHTVGPVMANYAKDEDKCYEMLFLAVWSAMELADRNGCRSVAIPAISAAIFGVPMRICTKAYWDALQSFVFDENNRCNIQVIHFINIDENATCQIADAFWKLMNSPGYTISS